MMRVVFYGLLAALIIGGIYMAQTGKIPEWEKCRESLFTQIFSGKCTPRTGQERRNIIIPGGGQDT